MEITSHEVEGISSGITIQSLGERTIGNAFHKYELELNNPSTDFGFMRLLIQFQNGDPKVVNQNGITMEALLAVVEDRLVGFQAGAYPHPKNEEALQAVRMALKALHNRTREVEHV